MDIDFKNQQINVQIHVVEIFVQSREGVWFEEEVIFTGSEDNPKLVSVYTIQGFKEHLPDLVMGRYLHGCSYYINSDNKQVRKTHSHINVKDFSRS